MKGKKPGYLHRAENLAVSMHAGQERLTGGPYINHCRQVARNAEDLGMPPELIAAAWLHDIVEDTPMTLDQIHESFPLATAAAVEYMTDVYVPGSLGWSRFRRKKAEADRLARGTAPHQTLKLCDVASNSSDLPELAKIRPVFVITYVQEIDYLLDVLTDADSKVWNVCRRQLDVAAGDLGVGIEPAATEGAQ